MFSAALRGRTFLRKDEVEIGNSGQDLTNPGASPIGSNPPPEMLALAESGNDDLQIKYRIVFWVIAVLSAFLNAWRSRFVIWPDGLSYLDMGDAYFRRDWKMAINGVWSPLYSWLIVLPRHLFRVPIYWESTTVHLVNFVIFVLVLCSFEFFLNALILLRVPSDTDHATMRLPGWSLRALGYALFLLSSVKWLTLEATTPDFCVEGIVFLIAGNIIQIRAGDRKWLRFAALGLLLGIGYLAKAVLFPLAFVFLAASFFSSGASRRAVGGVLLACAVFLLVGLPLIAALSKAKGHLTYSDSGWFNYLWCVDIPAPFDDPFASGSPSSPGARRYNQRFGTPTHPITQLLAEPPLYEFSESIGGTYPFWYNPAYWYEGMVPRFLLRRQFEVLRSNLYISFDSVISVQYDIVAGFLALCLLVPSRKLFGRCLLQQAHLWVPATVPLLAYAFVQVQRRYFPGFLLVIWASLFSGLVLPRSQTSKKLVWCITLALLTTVSARVLRTAVSDVTHILRDRTDPFRNVADALRRMGVEPGDRVACIGHPSDAYWARLAGVTIVAEIPSASAETFWAAGPEIKSRVYETFTKTGARAIVCNRVPPGASLVGWQNSGSSNHILYSLARGSR